MNNYAQTYFSVCIEALRAHPKFEFCDDISKLVLKTSPQYQFTLATATEALEHFPEVIDEIPRFFATGNQKQIMRFSQFLNALNQGLVTKHDTSHLRILAMLYIAGEGEPLRYAKIKRICTNHRKGADDNDQALRERLNKIIKSAQGAGTVESKTSNLLGENGWAQITGLTFAAPRKQNREVFLNATHSSMIKLMSQLASATDAQLTEAFTPPKKK